MDKIFERMLFLALSQKDPAYPEYNECVDLWKEYPDAGFVFCFLKKAINKMEDEYPIPKAKNLNDLMPYILAESTNRIGILTLLSAWTHFITQEDESILTIDVFDYMISLAEKSNNDKFSNV